MGRFKIPEQRSCIDVFLRKSPLRFQHTASVFSGLFDFHKIMLAVSKAAFPKSKPNEIKCRDYKAFQFNFENELKQTKLLPMMNLKRHLYWYLINMLL